MTEANNSVLSFPQDSEDPLTKILRDGARRLLAQALEAEVAAYIDKFADAKDDQDRRMVVRNGHHPERTIQTGLGDVSIKQPKVNDRRKDRDGQRQRFRSSILPPYLRRTKNIEELLPWLYLKGLSTGDFSEALTSLLGKGAPGLSATTITRLKSVWYDEYSEWRKRDLSKSRFVYIWADGVYFNIRLGDGDRMCMLVIIGATEDGKKEVLAVEPGYRESKTSWSEILLRLRDQGLTIAPELAITDGALGFWASLDQVYPKTAQQRCWVHKTANVLEKLPKKKQPQAKSMIHDIYLADTRKDAEQAFDRFIEVFEDKYERAVKCLVKDRDTTLAFYDFPAKHWAHIRSTNPIESTFATVRLRSKKTKGCGSVNATVAMVFKLIKDAEKRWKKLRGYQLMADVIDINVRFVDGKRKEIAA